MGKAAKKSGFDGLLAWRARPEGEIHTTETNWSTVAANDNDPEDLADKHAERRWRIRPSMDDIEASMKSGIVERNEAGQVVRIGTLQFSDGTQTEKAYHYGPEGKLVQYDAVMPVGAMLHTTDVQERMLGGDDDSAGSDSYFKETLKVGNRHKSAIRRREDDPSFERVDRSNVDSKAILVEAYANTPSLPAVTYGKAALPWRPARLTDLFVGMKKGKKGESGSISWQDISASMVAHETWRRVDASLSDRDRETLDAVGTARTFADISPGGRRSASTRRGKRALLAANDNLMAAINKASA